MVETVDENGEPCLEPVADPLDDVNADLEDENFLRNEVLD